jgi:hypothetical protein
MQSPLNYAREELKGTMDRRPRMGGIAISTNGVETPQNRYIRALKLLRRLA